MTDQIENVDVIEVGPVAPSFGGMTYQITLESGAIVTSPIGFPQDELPRAVSAIVTADGRVLAVPPPREELEDEQKSEFEHFAALTTKLFQVPKSEVQG